VRKDRPRRKCAETVYRTAERCALRIPCGSRVVHRVEERALGKFFAEAKRRNERYVQGSTVSAFAAEVRSHPSAARFKRNAEVFGNEYADKMRLPNHHIYGITYFYKCG